MIKVTKGNFKKEIKDHQWEIYRMAGWTKGDIVASKADKKAEKAAAKAAKAAEKHEEDHSAMKKAIKHAEQVVEEVKEDIKEQKDLDYKPDYMLLSYAELKKVAREKGLITGAEQPKKVDLLAMLDKHVD